MPLPRPAEGQLKWWVVGGIGITLGVLLVVWYGLAYEAVKVTPRVTAFKVVDDTQIVIDFDVHRPGGKAATCSVVALDARYGTVGSQEVAIPAGPGSVHEQVTLRTTQRAVAADVPKCSLVTP